MAKQNELTCAVWAWLDGGYVKILETDADGRVTRYIGEEEIAAVAQAAVDQAAELLSV